MSKELSPLEALNSIKFGCCDFESRTLYQDELKIVETALKEVQTYEIVLQEYGFNLTDFREACFLLKQFRESGFANIESTLKALEIIKEKIDVGVVILGDKPKIRITYNGQLRFYDIVQEEYELLKEVLL